MAITFGPVPSRRLGRSLGINNIPPKSCSYSCLYCQVGITNRKILEPRHFYSPQAIYQAANEHLQRARSANEPIDYLTFVPDGEPTLDINLGKAIDALRPLNIPIAVITNASLLWQEKVRAALHKADWVSVKVDSVIEDTWKQINRPHETLQLNTILDGIRLFAKQFQGELASETMLIENINDSSESLNKISDFLLETAISTAYLSIPTRPTAEADIHGPTEPVVNNAYQILAAKLPRVEYLIGYEGDAFAFTGDARQDLLSITAVHPMRESAIKELLDRANADWSLVNALVAEHLLKEVEYVGNRYYVRSFTAQHPG